MNRYTDSELTEFKNIIQMKLDESKRELARLKEEISANQPGSQPLEDAAEHTLRDELTLIASRQEKMVGELNAAMMRIHNRTYGICSRTGDLIPKERLRLVPQTTLSLAVRK